VSGSNREPVERQQVQPDSRAAWRAWLEANHASSIGVWLVTWRAATGRPTVGYQDAVEEALCFGWVDSQGGKVDDERSKLWMCPRKPRSGWARTNKDRVARLEAAGLMAPAGLAAIEVAKHNGAWTLLDDVENLIVPDDLAAGFDRFPGSREKWDAFPKSARRAILQWIVHARRPETRARRIAEAAEAASRGERANEWKPKS
jgi:uncharacterized protein YdeI (YjbR/CyaY-like superfamily)